MLFRFQLCCSGLLQVNANSLRSHSSFFNCFRMFQSVEGRLNLFFMRCWVNVCKMFEMVNRLYSIVSGMFQVAQVVYAQCGGSACFGLFPAF